VSAMTDEQVRNMLDWLYNIDHKLELTQQHMARTAALIADMRRMVQKAVDTAPCDTSP